MVKIRNDGNGPNSYQFTEQIENGRVKKVGYETLTVLKQTNIRT